MAARRQPRQRRFGYGSDVCEWYFGTAGPRSLAIRGHFSLNPGVGPSAPAGSSPHLLPKPYKNYAEFELACLDRALAKMLGKLRPEQAALAPFAKAVLTDSEITQDSFDGHAWGEQNTAKIQHPLSKAIPSLGWLLDMPSDELPGDIGHVVRAQGPAFGASQRLSVSPGHEEKGLLHMPGGQSGHPLSPFYGAGHNAWVNGEPTPLLPGASLHLLTLMPMVTEKSVP